MLTVTNQCVALVLFILYSGPQCFLSLAVFVSERMETSLGQQAVISTEVCAAIQPSGHQ